MFGLNALGGSELAEFSGSDTLRPEVGSGSAPDLARPTSLVRVLCGVNAASDMESFFGGSLKNMNLRFRGVDVSILKPQMCLQDGCALGGKCN